MQRGLSSVGGARGDLAKLFGTTDEAASDVPRQGTPDTQSTAHGRRAA
jgi:hypothetical protein